MFFVSLISGQYVILAGVLGTILGIRPHPACKGICITRGFVAVCACYASDSGMLPRVRVHETTKGGLPRRGLHRWDYR